MLIAAMHLNAVLGSLSCEAVHADSMPEPWKSVREELPHVTWVAYAECTQPQLQGRKRSAEYGYRRTDDSRVQAATSWRRDIVAVVDSGTGASSATGNAGDLTSSKKSKILRPFRPVAVRQVCPHDMVLFSSEPVSSPLGGPLF